MNLFQPKELLQDLYPDLTIANIKDELNISDSEEVYLLRIPKTVDPQQLLNKEVDLIFGSKVKVGSKKYEFVPTNKASDPILLVGNQSRTVQPKNTLFLKKYIKSPKLPDLELIEKAMIPLPENLKPRHPLFGSNYEDKIQLSSSVELRLQKAINDCLKEKVKKKNKRKKVSRNILENDMNEDIFSLLGNHIAQKPIYSKRRAD